MGKASSIQSSYRLQQIVLRVRKTGIRGKTAGRASAVIYPRCVTRLKNHLLFANYSRQGGPTLRLKLPEGHVTHP